MKLISPVLLLEASLLLYLLAALPAVFLAKKPKACNLLSNALCMAASLIGAASALLHLISGAGTEVSGTFLSAIPLVSFQLSIDQLSSFFILGMSIAAFCVSLYSIGYLSHYYGKRNVGLMNMLYGLFLCSMMLVISAGNAIFFLFAWEAMSAASYFLVVYESEQVENQRAGTLYLIMTAIGTAFLLAAFLIIYRYTGTLELSAGSAAIPTQAKNLLFVLFLVGFGTKAGIVPLHIWLPAAHPAAPGNVSALMSGVMIKTAIYGMLRFVFAYLGIQAAWWGVALLAIGMVSAVLGVAFAFVETDMKRMLAYSSIENIGILFIGLGVGAFALAHGNTEVGALAIGAALFHTLSHTLMKSGLFMGAGAVHYATHTKDMEKLGGLIRRLPVTAALVLCFSLAIAAIVPFNGFAGEWLTLQSIFAAITPGQAGGNIALILAVAALGLAGALAAATFAKLFGISFLGKPRSPHAEHAEAVPTTMNLGMGILAALCLGMGLFPMAALRLVDRVLVDLAGQGVSGSLSGWLLLRGDPLANAGGAVSPLGLLIALVIIALAAAAVIRLIGGRALIRKYGTWDCGYQALNARMQYSATGFSKPIKIVFRILFRPSRKFSATGEHQYHPEAMEYSVSSEPLFEKYLYEPLTTFIKKLSDRTKDAVQTGSIRRYLAYIFVALLALLLYNRLV